DAVGPEYYAYDTRGRLQVGRWLGEDHDWRRLRTQRDVTGLPQRIMGMAQGAERVLSYSADRRLTEVRQAGAVGDAGASAPEHAVLAHYTHNTHGLRIGKTVYATPEGGKPASATHTDYLWQGMRLVGETVPEARATVSDGQREPKADAPRLARRYVYAHKVPVALIDYTDGAEFRDQGDGGMTAWFGALWRWLSADAGELRFVHANEIGTPVAVSDSQARVIWRARPTAYGVVR